MVGAIRCQSTKGKRDDQLSRDENEGVSLSRAAGEKILLSGLGYEFRLGREGEGEYK